MRQLLSLDILTSAFNEEDNINLLYQEIVSCLVAFPALTWKLHIVDNHSSDTTWSEIRKLSQKDSRVTGYRMSRTFGFDAALTAMLDKAEAEAVVLMASDLQDPPHVIAELIKQYERGNDHVCVRIRARQGTPLGTQLLTKLFYTLLHRFTGGLLPSNVSDFRLVSKKCYQAARQLRERNRFLRGQFAWVGFNPVFVDIERPKRRHGTSKFLQLPRWSTVFYATSAIFSHSALPLLLIAGFGLALSILSSFVLIVSSAIWISSGVPFAGFGSIIGAITFGFSFVLLALGIMSIYLSLIYEEVKHRPLYLIQEVTDA